MTRFAADTRLTNANWLTSEADRRKMGKSHAHMQSLYSRRLEAARINAAKKVGGTSPESPELLSLPRDLGQSLPPSAAPATSPVSAPGAAGIIP
jgi:hypothetical protein